MPWVRRIGKWGGFILIADISSEAVVAQNRLPEKIREPNVLKVNFVIFTNIFS